MMACVLTLLYEYEQLGCEATIITDDMLLPATNRVQRDGVLTGIMLQMQSSRQPHAREGLGQRYLVLQLIDMCCGLRMLRHLLRMGLGMHLARIRLPLASRNQGGVGDWAAPPQGVGSTNATGSREGGRSITSAASSFGDFGAAAAGAADAYAPSGASSAASPSSSIALDSATSSAAQSRAALMVRSELFC